MAAAAIARHSFHGPVASVARKLEPVPAPPSGSALGRALLVAARTEQPTSADRERILAAVLAALRVLTGGV